MNWWLLVAGWTGAVLGGVAVHWWHERPRP